MSEELIRLTDRSQSEIEQTITIKTKHMVKMMMASVCDIGRDLTDLRAACPHGEWENTLKRLGFKKALAHNWMTLYREYGTSQVSLFAGENVQMFGNLEPSKALALIAIPSEEREAFAREIDAENASVREIKRQIQRYKSEAEASKNTAEGWEMKYNAAKEEADMERKERSDANQAALTYKQESERLARENGVLESTLNTEVAKREAAEAELTGLKNRPVEVAVKDASEEQIQQAEQRGRDEAIREAAGRLDEAEKNWQTVNEELKQKLTAAQEASSEEISSLREQLVKAQKQLTEAKQGGHGADYEKRIKLIATANEKLNLIKRAAVELESITTELDDITKAKITSLVAKFLTDTALRIKGAGK